MLELECLRGNLVNLYFDAEIVAQQRERGIIGFFDVLIENWLNVKGNKFVNAKEACVAETPTNEVSVQETVDWRSRGVAKKAEAGESALVLVKDFEYRLPERLRSKAQEEFGRKLYALGKEVLASEVKVNFGKKKPAEVKVAVDMDVDVASEVVEVERKVEAKVDKIKVTPTQIIVDEPEIVLPDSGAEKKPRKIKKIIKKLVIE